MSQPVKLSDGLVLDARLAGEIMERSIAGQVEFWARLGRSVEALLDGRQVLDLSRRGAARPISGCLESVDTPAGRQRVAVYLQAGPFPHYERHPDLPGMLVRIDESGKKTTGRFINRQFQQVKTKSTR
jgi:ParD-like antitoxin of type II bacterial toxin-antitoxin system